MGGSDQGGGTGASGGSDYLALTRRLRVRVSMRGRGNDLDLLQRGCVEEAGPGKGAIDSRKTEKTISWSRSISDKKEHEEEEEEKDEDEEEAVEEEKGGRGRCKEFVEETSKERPASLSAESGAQADGCGSDGGNSDGEGSKYSIFLTPEAMLRARLRERVSMRVDSSAVAGNEDRKDSRKGRKIPRKQQFACTRSDDARANDGSTRRRGRSEKVLEDAGAVSRGGRRRKLEEEARARARGDGHRGFRAGAESKGAEAREEREEKEEEKEEEIKDEEEDKDEEGEEDHEEGQDDKVRRSGRSEVRIPMARSKKFYNKTQRAILMSYLRAEVCMCVCVCVSMCRCVFVVWCGVVWCGVVCCAVLCCVVLCCVVLCRVLLCVVFVCV